MITASRTEERTALVVVPRRKPGQWILAAAVALMVVVVGAAFIRSPHIDWEVVREYLFHPNILRGVGNTLLLTGLAVGLGSIIGLAVALMRMSGNAIFEGVARGFVYVFRGIPVLVQLILWFNLALIFPALTIGIPFTNISFVSLNTNEVLTPLVASIIGLSLAEAAYASEIFRSGFISVPSGQTEAAKSLGIPGPMIVRRIVLPQAMRVILPPMGNQVIHMLKTTAIVAFIAGSELFSETQKIYGRTYQVIELLIVATAWYLVMVSILSYVQARLERHLNRGYAASRTTRQETK